MKPFVKWAGGKRQILTRIKDFIELSKEDKNSKYTYIEPFLGGGAVFFDIKPEKAIINDLNTELMNTYDVIRSDEYTQLIELLNQYTERYNLDADGFYYEQRSLDRLPGWPENYTKVERATRMIFLNRTCYNGLYRVNSKGQFNTPIGRYVDPLICDEQNIIKVHNFLSSFGEKLVILNGSYEEAIRRAKAGDIIYIDPPYDYEDDDGFTKYQMSGFTFQDFKNLKTECDRALKKGAYIIISNNATKRVLKLFNEDPQYQTIYYDADEFQTLRNINCKSTKRKSGKEVIIWGFKNEIPFPQANDIKKIVTLMKQPAEVLANKEQLESILKVSGRQVSYYLSALAFFGFIDGKKNLTQQAINLPKKDKDIKKYIYNTLLNRKLFKRQYLKYAIDKKINKEKLIKSLKRREDSRGLSKATLDRRASTIKSWVEWMYKYEGKNV